MAVVRNLSFVFTFALALAALQLSQPESAATHIPPGGPEVAITGHAVLISNGGAGGPGATAPPGPNPSPGGPSGGDLWNECVVWFNGVVVFDGDVDGDHNLLNDNAGDPCGEGSPLLRVPTDFALVAGIAAVPGLVYGMEAGDCDPRGISIHPEDVEFVRDLSFTDPTGQPHHVAEIRYSCPPVSNASPEGCALEALTGDDQGCGSFLHGLDDRGPGLNMRSLFKEYTWVTLTHPALLDPTLNDGNCLYIDPADPINAQDFCHYNYALVLDTCNDHPVGPGDNGRQAHSLCTDGGGVEFVPPAPHRSSHPFAEPRFDDTARTLHVHAAEPGGHDAVRDGNSNPNVNGCDNPDDHREDKSVETGDPCDGGLFGETDYDPAEDHLAAQVMVLPSSNNCDDPLTPVAQVFCQALAAGLLTPQAMNHPGCTALHDARYQGPCWAVPFPPDDTRGVGGPVRGHYSHGNAFTGLDDQPGDP